MKILHLLNSDRFSGAENVACQIIDMFRGDDRVEMLYCSRDGSIRDTLAERGIPFVAVSDMSVAEVRRVIRETGADIIHAHDMRASFIAARACGKLPLVSHIHNNAFDSRGISLKSIAYCLAAQKARHIFWVSQSAFEGYAFHKRFAQKSSVLYNIISVEALYEKMRRDENCYEYDVVYLGRLTYPKNPQRLMQLCRLLVQRKPDIKIAVVGTGELEAEVKALAAELALDERVQFLGFQSNPLKILHDARVMVMTSRWEGTPMCALEAMALGVPVVSTPVDGLKDLVIGGETGYLSDEDEGLADAILRIVEDDALHAKLSEQTYAAAVRYNDLESYKKSLAQAYRL